MELLAEWLLPDMQSNSIYFWTGKLKNETYILRMKETYLFVGNETKIASGLEAFPADLKQS